MIAGRSHKKPAQHVRWTHCVGWCMVGVIGFALRSPAHKAEERCDSLFFLRTAYSTVSTVKFVSTEPGAIGPTIA